MARIEIDPNYSSPTFSRATASTDLFKKEDVQALAAALSTHDHSTGKGVVLSAGAIPNGTITSAMIADGTIVAGDIADGAVTSAKILDGTIATADLANSSVTNAKLASDTARDNLLTNGGFEIWQRGNGPFTAGNAWTADQWQIQIQGTDTLSISRNNTEADTGNGSQYCAGCTYVQGNGSGSGLFGFIHAITDGQQLANRTISLSMHVKASAANAVRIGLYNGASWAYSNFHGGNVTVYETLTVTTTLTGASGSRGQVGIFFSASCTAYLDNAMLVVGSVAADYAPLHPADDLARCLRYYEVYNFGSAADLLWSPGIGYSTTTVVAAPHYFKVQKPIVPTVTITPNSFNVRKGAVAPTAGTMSAGTITGGGFLASITAAGVTDAAAYAVGPVTANTALQIEANP